MKKVLNFIIFLVLMTIFTSNIFAVQDLNSTSESVNNEGRHISYTYYIKNYDVDIQVTENHVLNITETIDVYFNDKSHGIFREIPLFGTIDREDGSSLKYRGTISNLSVNEMYSESVQNSNKYIKIGNPNKYEIGDKQYIIKYSYKLSGDNSKEFDELFYNIIGTGWNAPIDKVTFKIQMPKEFNEEKLGFTHGILDSIETDKIFYEIDGNTIIGEFIQILQPREGLTRRLELPEGYFIVNINIMDYIMFNLSRQIFAVSIMFLGSKYLFERNFKYYFLFVIIAMCFHTTAIIMLPMYFLLNMKITKKYLLKYIKEFHKLYPNITIEISTDPTGELKEKLKLGMIDLIIAKMPKYKESEYEYKVLGKLEDIFVCNEKYQELSQKEISLEELSTYPILLQKNPSSSREYIDSVCHERNIELKSIMNIASSNLLIDFVKIGYGIGFVTKQYVLEELHTKELFEIKVRPTIPPREFGLIQLKEHVLSFSAQALIELIERDN